MNTKMTLLSAALAMSMFAGSAQAAVIECGNSALGLRTTTVNPALSCTYAGLDNLGDLQLVTLLNSIIASDTSTLVDRDDSNSDGEGLLSITGVGGTSGGWSFESSVWDDYARVFLYFHFGDSQDEPGPTSTTDPDIFIVELASANLEGSWEFSGQQGLSNIALLGAGEGGGGGDDEIPEPGVLFLMGAGLLGLGLARRRKSA